jgi:Leishmanolysin/Cornifin (SPRR) family
LKVLHEMGHILGIGGTGWNRARLITPPGVLPVQFTGTNGIAGHAEIGGSGNPTVEDNGGPGTARAHWDEDTYKNELMTGFISGQTQPMSRMTVRSLVDLGYQVNVNQADNFAIPGATKAPSLAGGATKAPTIAVTKSPTSGGTKSPTNVVTKAPTNTGTKAPTNAGTKAPTSNVATKAPTSPNNDRFDIQLKVFGTPLTPPQQQAFDAAIAKWMTVIVGDFQSTLAVAGQICGRNLPVQETVDDIMIFAEISPIDGPGKV